MAEFVGCGEALDWGREFVVDEDVSAAQHATEEALRTSGERNYQDGDVQLFGDLVRGVRVVAPD